VFNPDLSQREFHSELMDEPGLAPSEHHRGLEALALVNRLSLTAARIWREILREWSAARDEGGTSPGARSGHGPQSRVPLRDLRPLRILDVACGGGDVAVALKRRAATEGVPVEVHGCDVSFRALARAECVARREGLEISFFQLDAVRSPLPSGFDIVCSSLFLHHLSEEEAIKLLAKMAEAGRTVFLQDLLRTRRGYWLALATLHFLSRSRVARVDGPRSVRASYRIPEVAALARRAGLEGARIVPCWPQRFALSWRRT
jgi:2-polyprenyl-3-methyl-5-hydroxy-6-metoxy-1,4-benzoquinol methylase